MDNAMEVSKASGGICESTHDFRYFLDSLSSGVVVLRSFVEVDQSSGGLGCTHLLQRIISCCQLKGERR